MVVIMRRCINKTLLFTFLCAIYFLFLCACGSNQDGSISSEVGTSVPVIDASKERYANALDNLNSGDFDDALSEFIDLGSYEESSEKAKECYYKIGCTFEADGDFSNAADNYKLADNYLDADECYSRCNYELATEAIAAENWDEAISLLTDIDYEDSNTLLENAEMQKGMHEYADYDFINALEDALEYRLNATQDEGYETIVNTELGRLQQYKEKEYYNEYISYYVEKYIGGIEMQKDALNYNYSDFQIKWQEGAVERYQVITWLYEYFGAYADNQKILDSYVFQLDSAKERLAMYQTVNADMLEQLDGAMWDWNTENSISCSYYNSSDYTVNVTFYFFFYNSSGTRIDDNIVTYSDIKPQSSIDITTYCPPQMGDSFDYFWEFF